MPVVAIRLPGCFTDPRSKDRFHKPDQEKPRTILVHSKLQDRGFPIAGSLGCGAVTISLWLVVASGTVGTLEARWSVPREIAGVLVSDLAT